MSKNQSETTENKDDILQAFEQSKEEQLDLLDDFVKDSKTVKPKAKTKKEKQESKPEPVQEEEPEAPKEPEVVWIKGYDGIEYEEDEWNAPVVRNGPTRREVEGWKERHNGLVYFTPFESDVFVWRTLHRPEYREIIRDQTLSALDREELFTEKCVLYPYDFSIEKIKKSRAGIASLLSEMIMDKSGFVAQSAPIKL